MFPSPIHMSLFMQPRSLKLARRVKFDCPICLSCRNSRLPFQSSAFGGRGEAVYLVYLRLRGLWRGKPVIDPTVMLSLLSLLAS